jgi:hypothetical protein
MTTVPCPKNDGGICTIPDQTALVRTSGLELVSRSAVLDRFPAAEAEEGLLTLVAGDHQQIMQALERPQELRHLNLRPLFRPRFVRVQPRRA